MQKNVNFMLLTIIILIIMILAGISIYYQSTYTNMSSLFSAKVSELEKTRQELESKQNILSKTNEELGLKQEREQELSKLYENVTDVKESLEDQNTDLRASLKKSEAEKEDYYYKWKTTESELDTTKTNLLEKTAELEEASTDVKAYKSATNNLAKAVNVLLNTITNYQGQDATPQACKDILSDVKGDANDVSKETDVLKNV
ncbi:hypothetical protein HZB01_02605 [Candidatus Woesearchaeota archaeon]|nr:hypothetical protein [Candidatus Woesearchaeota archaeon]